MDDEGTTLNLTWMELAELAMCLLVASFHNLIPKEDAKSILDKMNTACQTIPQ